MSDLTPTLTLTPNIDSADDFYADLLATHDGLSNDASRWMRALCWFWPTISVTARFCLRHWRPPHWN